MAVESGCTVPTDVSRDYQQRLDDWLESWHDGTMESLDDKEPDPFLVEHFTKLTNDKKEMKILVPLCGTCIDMKWLSERGHRVVGVEVSEVAAQLFFQHHNIPHEVLDVPHLQGKLYKSEDDRIKFYVSDFYRFNETIEGYFDAVWDTGSLGSIDIRDRKRYMTAMMKVIKPSCVYLLETLVYDRRKFEGPPYCFYEEDIKEIFGEEFTVVKVAEHDYDVPEGEGNIAKEFDDIGFKFHFYCLNYN